MHRRSLIAGAAAAAFAPALPALGQGQPLRIGLIAPMTGPFAAYGAQLDTGLRIYLEAQGGQLAGRAAEVVLRDDAGTADQTRRIAQEMVSRGEVDVLAGFGLTPLALAAAPISARAGVPQLVMVAAASSVTEKSPMIVRTSYTTPQVTSQIAAWVLAQGTREAMTLVMDYGPGTDAEARFVADFTAGGGTVSESLRVPLQNPDFSAYLQRVADRKPPVLFVFVPSGVGQGLLKQFVERGLDTAGVRIVADGSMTDEFQLPQMGDVAEGIVTGLHYSAAHDSDMNRDFVARYLAASGGVRPCFMAVAAWDGAYLLGQALGATGGEVAGAGLVAAMRGQAWESPRGPVSIDPETRDIVQNVYMRRVEKRDDGQLWNVEFETFEDVRDPDKA